MSLKKEFLETFIVFLVMCFIIVLFLILLNGCGSPERQQTNKSQQKTWPNGQVYYKFNPEISEQHIKQIETIFNTIEDKTKCIYFLKSDQIDSIEIIYSEDSNNWASIGYTNDNYIKLNRDVKQRHIYHETFHAIGMTHEHQRPDRDNYIQVVNDNIYPECLQYFSIKQPLYDIDKHPYDINSIMHYHPASYTDTKSIIFLEDNYIYSTEPTDLDYQKIISIYSN